MTEQPDDQLLADLASALAAADPVPPSVRELGRVAWDLRSLDEELAELVADSLTDTALAARAGGGPRLLTFASAGLDVEVQVEAVGDRRRVTGQAIPTGPTRIVLERRDGAAQGTADEEGRFAFDGVPPGPVRLRVRRPGARAVVSEWVLL